MNYIEQIGVITSTLRAGGFEPLAEDISELQLSGGTGGEVLISVCSRLLGIKGAVPQAYALIRAQAEQLITYANSIGLYSKPTMR